MAPPLLHLRDIHLTFGGHPVLDGAELRVAAGEKICLVGRNGSGKSTLLKIASGDIEPESGERFVHPGATIRYLPQEPDLSDHPTVGDYVLAGGEDNHLATRLVEDLGLTMGQSTAALSGGEIRRAALARVLAAQPDILLLDEPTNHLDLPAITWLEQEIGALATAVVLISHDRRFLEALARATVWLDRGRTRQLNAPFARFEEWRDELLEQEEAEHHKLGRKIAMEEHWLRYGVTARRKRNVRRLGLLQDMRRAHRERRAPQSAPTARIEESTATGKIVAEATKLTKAYGDTLLVKDFSLRIARGDRIGIVGPNGAGKTTLLNLLTGQTAPDSGSIEIAATVDLVTLDQRRESLDPTATVAETLTGGRGDTVTVGGKPRHVIGYMKDFLFAPEMARTPVGALSGGERGRLMLARALARPSNLLVLDEPTNDLDLETLDLLQELLIDYSGTILLISHDRDFLDRTVTSVIAAAGNGRWIEYAGGYSDMLAQAAPTPPAATTKARPPSSPRNTADRTDRPAEPVRKMTMAELEALKTLPALIEKLEAEITMLADAVANPTLYTRDPALFTRATARLGAAQQEKATAEDRWLELELLKEQLA